MMMNRDITEEIPQSNIILYTDGVSVKLGFLNAIIEYSTGTISPQWRTINKTYKLRPTSINVVVLQ